MSPNICQLFKVRPNVEEGVSIVETPLTYIGTNDNAVVHIQPLPKGRFRVDDGGNADWFASTAGYDFENNSVSYFIKQYSDLLDVHVDENGDVYSYAKDENDLSIKILRVAQFSVSLHSKAVLRQEKVNSAFKEELREAILSVMKEDEIKEQYTVPDSHDLVADYLLHRSNSSPIYIIAASDKSRLLEAELLSVQLKSQKRKEKVIAVVESQRKVSQSEYERSSFFLEKSLVFNKELLPDMLQGLN